MIASNYIGIKCKWRQTYKTFVVIILLFNYIIDDNGVITI